MPPQKVTDLTAATELTDADVLYVVDGSTSKKITAANAAAYFGSSGPVTSQPFTKTADYTLDSLDGGLTFIMDSSSPLDLFVPTHATDDIELYSFIQVIQAGTGAVTVSAVTPGTTSIRSLGNLTTLAGQYASATLYKADDDLWYLSGALT
jgi:hypothetical protein